MLPRKKLLFVALLLISGLFLAATAYSAPPRPGPNFVWVAPHTNQNGVYIQGHWKYVGPSRSDKVWVQGHYNKNGKWVAGHWKKQGPSKKGKTWVPGHRAPNGRWVPGHWR
jgi:hypothetical protein